MTYRRHVPWLAAALALCACTQEVPPASAFAKTDASADTAADTATDTASDTATDAAADSASCPVGQCDDKNPCTTDTCAGTGCVYTPRANGSDCGPWHQCSGGQCGLVCSIGSTLQAIHDGASSASVCAAESPFWGSGLPSPTQLTDQGDGTVLDGLTGLQWQQASAPTPANWKQAVAYCDTQLVLAGQADWRLPTRVELSTLLDFAQHNPAIATKIFADTSSGAYWSSSATLGAPLEAWTVSFEWGLVTSEIKELAHGVRCVRGMTKPPAAAKRYTFNATAGTVLDSLTGRTWQRTVDTSGGTDGKGQYTYMQALGYCSKLGLAGGGWRLPTIVELRGLVDPWRDPPALDPTAFAGAPADAVWSGTEQVGTSTMRWYVHFLDGFSDTDDVAELHRVRCVR